MPRAVAEMPGAAPGPVADDRYPGGTAGVGTIPGSYLPDAAAHLGCGYWPVRSERTGASMQDTRIMETIGPVDVAVIVFRGNEFTGDVAPAIADLQDRGIVRVIDLTFVRKDADGAVSVVEAADSAVAGAFARLTESEVELLSDTDLDRVAEELEPDSSALVVVWENSWAARLATSVRASHGEVARLERIPRDVVATAFAALDAG